LSKTLIDECLKEKKTTRTIWQNFNSEIL